MSKQELALEKLGQELAAKCNWDKNQILTVAFQALTDANYHDEAARVLDRIDADE